MLLFSANKITERRAEKKYPVIHHVAATQMENLNYDVTLEINDKKPFSKQIRARLKLPPLHEITVQKCVYVYPKITELWHSKTNCSKTVNVRHE